MDILYYSFQKIYFTKITLVSWEKYRMISYHYIMQYFSLAKCVTIILSAYKSKLVCVFFILLKVQAIKVHVLMRVHVLLLVHFGRHRKCSSKQLISIWLLLILYIYTREWVIRTLSLCPSIKGDTNKQCMVYTSLIIRDKGNMLQQDKLQSILQVTRIWTFMWYIMFHVIMYWYWQQNGYSHKMP